MQKECDYLKKLNSDLTIEKILESLVGVVEIIDNPRVFSALFKSDRGVFCTGRLGFVSYYNDQIVYYNGVKLSSQQIQDLIKIINDDKANSNGTHR